MTTNIWAGIAAVALVAVTIWALVTTPGVTLPQPGPPCTVERLAAMVAATPTPPDQNVVTSLLAVETTGGVPRLSGQFIVSTTADREEIVALRSLTPGRNEYLVALERLLSADGVGPFSSDQVEAMVAALRQAPMIIVMDRLATLLFPAPESVTVLAYGEIPASNWVVSPAGVDLVFRTWGSVPDGSTWRGGLCLDDMRIVSEGVPPPLASPPTSLNDLPRIELDPPPASAWEAWAAPAATPEITVSGGDGSYFWSHSGDSSLGPPLTTVQVRARPDASTVVRLALFSGDGWFLARAWLFLVLLVPPAVAIWLIRPRVIPVPAAPELRAAVARQRIAASAIIQFLIVGLLLTAVAFMRSGQYLASATNPKALPSLGLPVLLVLGLIVTTMWYVNGETDPRSRWLSRRLFIATIAWLAIWLIWIDAGWPERWQTIARALVAFGFGQFAAAGVRLRKGRHGFGPGRWMGRAAAVNIVAGVVLSTLAETTWFVAALIPLWIIGCFAFGMVRLIVGLVPEDEVAPDAARRWLPAVSVVAIGFGIVTLGQWAWWTLFYRIEFQKRELLFEDPSRGFAAVANEIQRAFANFGETFQLVIPDLTLFVLLVGVVGVLAASATATADSLLGKDRRWLRGLVVFLFATFVAGYGGQVLGYRFPLAWLSVFVLAPITLRPAPPPPTEAGSPAAAEGLEAPVSEREVNASGLAPVIGWWDNGWHAARAGAVLAILPVGYFLFVLGSVGGERLVSRDANFGAVTLLSSLTFEYTVWVVAAFTLGCLYSSMVGQFGPVRGLLLAGVFAGARGLELLVFGGDGVVWVVRSFGLALFLTVVGALLDARNLPSGGGGWRNLFTQYRLEDLKATVGYFYPIAIALIGVIKLLQGNQIFNAVDTLITDIIMALPPVPALP